MIDRCICHNKSFKEIEEECAARAIRTIDDLVDKIGAGDKCAMCLPYLSTMLETGETEFK